MTIQSFYRVCLWLPLALPAAATVLVRVVGVRALGWPLDDAFSILVYSFLYGGVPYALLALWATWWIGKRPEREIERLVVRAPWLMAGACIGLSVIAGVWVRELGMVLAV